jgi:integrase
MESSNFKGLTLWPFHGILDKVIFITLDNVLHPSFIGMRYTCPYHKKGGFFMAATEPIRDKKQLNQLAGYWLKRGNLRNYALIVLGVCTALRISDLLRLTWEDVYDGEREDFRSHVTITERKTGKQKTIALNRQAVKALRMYFPYKRGKYIFANNRKEMTAISRIQAWRIIRAAAEAIGAMGRIACHSLRKTFGYHAWRAGVLPVMLMDIYNHSSFEITRRYLGISQDDRDKVYLAMALF